jgi:hypothetical protein
MELRTKAAPAAQAAPAVPTLQSYWDMLYRHDWYYDFSDDGSVRRAGQAAEAKLQAIAKASPEHQALWDGWSAHFFTGPTWAEPNYREVAPPYPPRPQ